MGRKFTEEDTKAYLRTLWEFSEKNHKRLMQIMELRAAAESCTVRTDKESIQSSGSGDKMANIVGKIVDIEQQICDTDKIITRRRAEFEELSSKMTDDRQREFLTIRYYDGHGFCDTAMMMDLSDSTAKRVHKKAITEFTNLFNEKHYI